MNPKIINRKEFLKIVTGTSVTLSLASSPYLRWFDSITRTHPNENKAELYLSNLLSPAHAQQILSACNAFKTFNQGLATAIIFKCEKISEKTISEKTIIEWLSFLHQQLLKQSPEKLNILQALIRVYFLVSHEKKNSIR